MARVPSRSLVARVRESARCRTERALGDLGRRTRHATSTARLRPTFLVIGAQKSGTTSLHAQLRQNPAVLTASVKEVQYFNKEFRRGERWYLSHFPLRLRAAPIRRRLGIAPQVGEATAAYLFDPRVPTRVQAFQPETKLIAILRDPVARAVSHYQMELRWERELLPFEDALRREEVEYPRRLERIAEDPLAAEGFAPSYIARGRYAEQLERWFALFPRKQLLVVVYEELVGDPAGQLERIADFLEVPHAPTEAFPHRGRQTYSPPDPASQERLARIFEPENRRLEKLLGRSLPWTTPADGESPVEARQTIEKGD